MALQHGCGDYLAKLLAEFGSAHSSGCGCNSMRIRMNLLGPRGCRSQHEEIVAHLVKQSKVTTTAMPFGLDLADLLGELVDEAIRLAETGSADNGESANQ